MCLPPAHEEKAFRSCKEKPEDRNLKAIKSKISLWKKKKPQKTQKQNQPNT